MIRSLSEQLFYHGFLSVLLSLPQQRHQPLHHHLHPFQARLLIGFDMSLMHIDMSLMYYIWQDVYTINNHMTYHQQLPLSLRPQLLLWLLLRPLLSKLSHKHHIEIIHKHHIEIIYFEHMMCTLVILPGPL